VASARQVNGLPPGHGRQVGERAYAGAAAPAIPGCRDPGVLAIAEALACAIRDARPVVTLPPHLFMPWRADPLFIEARAILDSNVGADVTTGASNASAAAGIALITQDAATAYGALASYRVPSGSVAVIRRLGVATDELGYFVDNTGQPAVDFVLSLGDKKTLLPVGRLGTYGTLEQPLEVSYVVPQDLEIQVLARSKDTTTWHLVEACWEGFLIHVNDIEDTLRSLLPEACGGAR